MKVPESGFYGGLFWLEKHTQSPNWLDLFSPLKLLIGIVNKSSIKLFDLLCLKIAIVCFLM